MYLLTLHFHNGVCVCGGGGGGGVVYRNKCRVFVSNIRINSNVFGEYILTVTIILIMVSISVQPMHTYV